MKKRKKSQKLDDSKSKKKKVAEPAKPKRKSKRKKNEEVVEVPENEPVNETPRLESYVIPNLLFFNTENNMTVFHY